MGGRVRGARPQRRGGGGEGGPQRRGGDGEGGRCRSGGRRRDAALLGMLLILFVICGAQVSRFLTFGPSLPRGLPGQFESTDRCATGNSGRGRPFFVTAVSGEACDALQCGFAPVAKAAVWLSSHFCFLCKLL